LAPNYTGAMDLNTFEFIGKTENKARLYFKKYYWKNRLMPITPQNRYNTNEHHKKADS